MQSRFREFVSQGRFWLHPLVSRGLIFGPANTLRPRLTSRVASGLLCLHAIAITPADPMELVRSSISIVSGLPCETVRSAPAIVVSGPVLGLTFLAEMSQQ